MLPPFKRAYKKLHDRQKAAVNAAVSAITALPEVGEPKRGDLAGVYAYKFDCVDEQYLLAYGFR